MKAASVFEPHRWVRNPHLQSVLASSKLRLLRHRGSRRLALLRDARVMVLDCGDGARLEAYVTPPPGVERPDLVVMIHGWEGGASSTYLLATGERLHLGGFAVARLNLRDHGDTHALNEGLFHADRVDEVAGAVAALARDVPHRRLFLIGFSLGGNFALRVALRARRFALDVARVIAINPALDPRSTLDAIDRLALYRGYFVRRWKQSLAKKAAAFPRVYDFSGLAPCATVRAVSELVIPRYTPFPTVDDYLESYTIRPRQLAELDVPATLVTAADDPIIAVAHFRALAQSDRLSVEIQERGGHCGYIEGPRLSSWIETRIVDLIGA